MAFNANSATATGWTARPCPGSSWRPPAPSRASPRVSRPRRGTRSFGIRFRGGPGSLPSVDLDEVLAGNLVRSLVEGRTVLVGPVGFHPSDGAETPTTEGSRMSSLEIHGHALDTLLRNAPVRRTGAGGTILPLLLLGWLGLALHQRFELGVAWGSHLCLVLLSGAGGVALLALTGWWIRVADVLLGQLILLALVLRQRLHLAQSGIDELYRDTASWMRQRLWPPSFFDSDDPWAQILGMIDQTLLVDRTIFLAAEDDSFHVREVAALRCNLDDIDERRRDIRRTPYSTALESDDLVSVEAYLRPEDDDPGPQHLVPLRFGGELEGFWALSFPGRGRAEVPGQAAAILAFADQIAELLYHRRRIHQERTGDRAVDRLLGTWRETERTRALAAAFELVRRRLGRLERLLDGLEVATAIFDLFGRLLETNRGMNLVTEREGLTVRSMSALDLVLALTGCDAPTAKRCLRHAVVDGETISLPAQLATEAQARYTLFIRPLAWLSPEDRGSTPFGLGGIAIELVDATAGARLSAMKSALSQRLGIQLRNDLGVLALSTSLLSRDGVPEERRRAVADVVREKIQATVDLVDECLGHLTRHQDDDRGAPYPVDARAILERVLAEARPFLEEHQVTPTLDVPRLMNDVFGLPRPLEDTFRSVLALVGHDARPGCRLEIHVVEEEESTRFTFSDQGYGLPQERLNAMIFGEATTSSEDEVRVLRRAVATIRSWGGSVTATSSLGTGLRFTVQLRRFL